MSLLTQTPKVETKHTYHIQRKPLVLFFTPQEEAAGSLYYVEAVHHKQRNLFQEQKEKSQLLTSLKTWANRISF